jgi:ABC-2 type transport system permease protein
MTAIVLVRERTAGTLVRMFVSGYNPLEIVSGYLLAYSVLATIQSLLVLIELNWIFELGYDVGQLGSIYLIMWILAIISMAIGMLVSNLARNEGQVFPFIPLVLISVILSGILLPIERLPDWVQVLSYLTPLYYVNEVLQILIGGGGLFDDWAKLISLLVYGLIIVSLATVSLRESD